MRLWVVFAVITWAAGGWQLATRTAPPPRLVTAHEVCASLQPPLQRWSTCGTTGLSVLGVQTESRRQCEAREEREADAAWSSYRTCVEAANAPDQIRGRQARHAEELVRYAAIAVALIAFVVAIPVLIGILYWLLFLVGRWVWRGFKQDGKHNSVSA